MEEFDIESILQSTRTATSELLQQAHLRPDSILVLGMSTSEIQGKRIGKYSNIEIGRAVVKQIIDILNPLHIHLAVQGCEHLNRALVVERSVAEAHNFEIVNVFPQIHAGGAGQIAAFENLNDPVEVEHIVADAGIDIGDTAIGMHVKFVQVPVRTSVKEIGRAHVTFLRSRPKYIGGPRAKYEWDPFDKHHC